MEAAKTLSRSCQVCRGRRYVVERAHDRALARVCTCAKVCEHCGGSGYVTAHRQEAFSQRVGPRSYEALSPCVCRVLERRIEGLNAAGIPGVLAHADFENYSPASPVPEVGPALHHAREVALKFAETYDRKAPKNGFVISGPVGTGKTHLLAAVLKHLILERGVAARYIEISLLYATIRNGFREGKSGGEIIGPLSDVEVLAIDELGRGRGSQFELDTMDELIARRYNAGRTTLFATNYGLDSEKPVVARGYRTSADAKDAAKDSDLLLDRVGERIYSRLCEMCEFITLPGNAQDHRRARQEVREKIVARPTHKRGH